MNNIQNREAPQFGVKQFLKAALPSYFFPFISSGVPAYFLNKEDLLQASYSTIALPSLLATIFCFVVLSEFQKRQILLLNRLTMTIFLEVIVLSLSLVFIFLLQLQDKTLDIIPSVLIGTAIVSITKPLKKTNI